MPREPLRPWGLVPAEGIRLGPPPWLGQLQGLSFCGGRGRGRGEAGGQRLRGAGCGEGSTSGFLQSHCSPWKAFSARVKCGLLALGLAWPWWGPVCLTTGPSLPSGTSEKNERQPQRRGWRWLPLPVWTGQQKGRRTPRPPRCSCGRMRTGVRARAMRFQLSWLSPLAFQKEQEINIQIHLSSEWSFAAKKNVTQTLQDLEVKPPGGSLRGNAEPGLES